MKPLGIHHMSALETSPAEFALFAAAAGCQSISIFTYGSPDRFPLVTQSNKQTFSRRVHDTGLQINNIDAFLMLPHSEVSDFLPAIDLGTELGARCVSTQLFDAEQARVTDRLAELCEYSEKRGLAVAVEFMPLSPGWNTLDSCLELIRNVAKANLGLSIDILHLIRSGSTPKDISAIPPELIRYAQLCDSHDLSANTKYAKEAMAGRLIPGEGEFPIKAFVNALPADVSLELEVPNENGKPAAERIKEAVLATRELLDQLN